MSFIKAHPVLTALAVLALLWMTLHGAHAAGLVSGQGEDEDEDY